jgi:hypothetical protein
MNQNRTASILQRFAVVMAVTAASYGLPQSQAQARVTGNGHGHTQHAHSQSQSTSQQQR